MNPNTPCILQWVFGLRPWSGYQGTNRKLSHIIRLRNLEGLHAQARKPIVLLEKENKALRQRVKDWEESDRDKNQKIEALSFQFEQMERLAIHS